MDSFKDWKNKYVDKDKNGTNRLIQAAKARQKRNDSSDAGVKEFNDRKHKALSGIKEDITDQTKKIARRVKTKIGHSLPSVVRSSVAALAATGKKLGAENDGDKKRYADMASKFLEHPSKRPPPKFSFSEDTENN